MRLLPNILGILVALSLVTVGRADSTENHNRRENPGEPAVSGDQKDNPGHGHEEDREDHPGRPKPPKPPKKPHLPPDPPELLLAEAVSEFQVNLSWVDQSTNELGFKLERSTDGANYRQIAQTLPDTVTYRDLNRFPDTKYFYRICAFNAKGDSTYSNVARTQTPAPSCQLSVASWGYSIPLLPSLTNVVGLTAGAKHATVLRQDGTVISWRTRRGSTQGLFPDKLTNIVAVAAGFYHSLALRADGTVAGWGDNSHRETDAPKKLANVVAIAAGRSHSLALKNDGTVVGWGDDKYGQSSPPRDLVGVVAIAAGAEFSLALRSDGTVVTWGDRLTSPPPSTEDLTDVVLIAAGDQVGLALHADGRISSWGYSGHHAPAPPADLSGIVALSGGRSRFFALRSDGTLASWGSDGRSSPPPPANLTGVVAISSCQNQNLALTTSPVPPTELSAQVQTDNRVSLSWINPSVPVGSIVIERTTNVGSMLPETPEAPADWTILATVPGDSAAYDDTSAEPNQLYAYRLQAFNDCGSSTYSLPAIAKCAAPVPRPISKAQTGEASALPQASAMNVTTAPAFESIALASPNGIQLQFTAQANQGYVILYRPTLETGYWQPLAMVDPLPFTHPVTINDPIPAGTDSRFYRLENH